MEVGGHRHPQADLQVGNIPGTHCTGGWVGLRAGLDGCGKSRLTGLRSPDDRVPILSWAFSIADLVLIVFGFYNFVF